MDAGSHYFFFFVLNRMSPYIAYYEYEYGLLGLDAETRTPNAILGSASGEGEEMTPFLALWGSHSRGLAIRYFL